MEKNPTSYRVSHRIKLLFAGIAVFALGAFIIYKAQDHSHDFGGETSLPVKDQEGSSPFSFNVDHANKHHAIDELTGQENPAELDPRESKIRELQAQVKELQDQRHQLGRKYWRDIRKYVEDHAELQPWYIQFQQYEQDYNRVISTSAYNQLADWLNYQPRLGAVLEDEIKEADRRQEEISKVRRYLLLDRINTLLLDPEKSIAVQAWLQLRLDNLHTTDRAIWRDAAGRDLHALGNALFPDEATLREIMQSSNRQPIIDQYAANHDLGNIDKGISDEAEFQLQKVTEYLILREATMSRIESILPAEFKQIELESNGIGDKLKVLWNEIRELSEQR